MTIINEEKQKKVLEEFSRRRGVIHKLMLRSSNIPIGHLVRSELPRSENEDCINVGVTLEFSFLKHFDIEKIDECDGGDSKFFKLNDLKFFSLISNLKMDMKSITERNPAYALRYDLEDEAAYRIGVSAIVNEKINELIESVRKVKTFIHYSDNYGRKILERHLDAGSYEALAEYIKDKIWRIPLYYSGKKFTLYFN